MKIAKIVIVVVLVGVMGWLAWNYFAGPLRYQREMHAFADNLETCSSFSEPVFMYVAGESYLHTVAAASDGRCDMTMESFGPHVTACSFAVDDLPALAQGFRDLADAVDMFGGYTFQYDSSNPDPLTAALNSDACATT